MTHTDALRDLEASLQKMDPTLRLEKQALMAAYTTLHLGGPADLLAHPTSPEQLKILLTEAKRLDVPVTLIGHGSNLVVRDGGIRGLVIRVCRGMREITAEGNILRAQAGAMLTALAMAAAEQSLGGLVFASGIPGTVGGGVYMNAGAYGGEIKQVVESVTVLTMDGALREYAGGELFSYRMSIFQNMPCVIVSAVFRLTSGEPETIQKTMHELMLKRRASQPLELPSAGSTFKRPVGGYAAALIDAAGLKGRGVGGAQVSQKHAGFVVNTGGATARDVLATITMIQEEVYKSSGIHLAPEVRIW